MEPRDEIFDDANGDLATGELESAVAKYRRCVEIDPEFFDGWHALGMTLMKIGRFPEAIEAGKRATELRPNDQIGWTSLSLFYNRNGDIKEAEAAGTKAKILGWGGEISEEGERTRLACLVPRLAETNFFGKAGVPRKGSAERIS